MAIDIEGLAAKEDRAKTIHENHGILPTIGCEVEVKWSTLFPALATEFFGAQDELGRFEWQYTDLSPQKQQEIDSLCLELDAELKPAYAATVEAGIPAGNDAYWEFLPIAPLTTGVPWLVRSRYLWTLGLFLSSTSIRCISLLEE